MIPANDLSLRLPPLLTRVQKPGRYTGGELNQVVKEWQAIPLRVALAFPDLYDLGMSNLGLAILYDLLNRQPDMLAERVYSPWVDLEAELRTHGLPLFSLESKRPLSDFDILGITLPYETLFTNTLNLLDLGGIPLRSAERKEADPLVLAGGHACLNPEPMAEFVDAFVIGEGEDVILEIARLSWAGRTGAARVRSCSSSSPGCGGCMYPRSITRSTTPTAQSPASPPTAQASPSRC